MSKLLEYQNEEALDILADIIEPATEILADAEISRIYNSGEPKLKLITYILKNHKKNVLEIMATLEGVPVEEYKCNVLTLPKQILELLNDEELIAFFESSASQEQNSSGSAMANIKEKE